MQKEDGAAFAQKWRAAVQMQTGASNPPPDSATAMAFTLLMGHDLGDVMTAIDTHCRRSPRPPTPQAVLEILEGPPEISDEALVILAMEKKTALGAIVRWRLTSHTLATASTRDVLEALRAQRPIIDKFIADVKAGNQLSPTIKQVLINSGVPLHKPSGPGMPALTDRQVHELETPAHSLPPADPVRAAQVQEMARGVAGAIQ